MNTQRSFVRHKASGAVRAPLSMAGQRSAARVSTVLEAAVQPPHPACTTLPQRRCHHVLADLAANHRLAALEKRITERFDAIAPLLQRLAAIQHESGFEARAQQGAQQALGFELDAGLIAQAWMRGLDMPALYAQSIFSALHASHGELCSEMAQQAARAQEAQSLFLDCGFHALDVSPCSDGRLWGLLHRVLRLPMSQDLTRHAYPDALFDVDSAIAHWERAELRRLRHSAGQVGVGPSRYLKLAVYRYSSSQAGPDWMAMDRVLERMNQFREAVRNTHGAQLDLLLLGVDTDIDSIRVHVPDGKGQISLHRYVDAAEIYRETLGAGSDEAHLRVHEATLQAAHKQGAWSAGDGEPQDGMRRFIATLLINNLSQIEYVADQHLGRYTNLDGAERFLLVGDEIDELQVRDLGGFVHLHSVEEGGPDLDRALQALERRHAGSGLPVPVVVHYRYDSRVPGARERVVAKGLRVRKALLLRHAKPQARAALFCHVCVQDGFKRSGLEAIAGDAS